MVRKPPYYELRQLQREFLQLRWGAICARNDQSFYSRHVDTRAVTFALGDVPDVLKIPGAPTAVASDSSASRHNIPSYVDPSAPLLTSAFLLLDAATCGLMTRSRQLTDFGDGMLAYDASKGMPPHGLPVKYWIV